MVKNCAIEGKESVGVVRTCDVEFAGRDGQTIERCIESVPNRKLSHAIEEDSFGFTRMLLDFWFSFVLGRTDLVVAQAQRSPVRTRSMSLHAPGSNAAAR